MTVGLVLALDSGVTRGHLPSLALVSLLSAALAKRLREVAARQGTWERDGVREGRESRSLHCLSIFLPLPTPHPKSI